MGIIRDPVPTRGRSAAAGLQRWPRTPQPPQARPPPPPRVTRALPSPSSTSTWRTEPKLTSPLGRTQSGSAHAGSFASGIVTRFLQSFQVPPLRYSRIRTCPWRRRHSRRRHASRTARQHSGDALDVLVIEQTPVSGSTSSTRRAATWSPAISATTERTCSYPVFIRKVGARP